MKFERQRSLSAAILSATTLALSSSPAEPPGDTAEPGTSVSPREQLAQGVELLKSGKFEDAERALTSAKEQAQHSSDPAVAAESIAELIRVNVALENYDAVGLWRTEVRTKQGDTMVTSPVVAKDSFSDGSELDGPDELKERLASEYGDRFARSLMRRLLTYALGRSLDLRDEKAVQELDKEFAAAGYRMRDMIQLVVSSELFNKHDHKHEHEEKILAP